MRFQFKTLIFYLLIIFLALYSFNDSNAQSITIFVDIWPPYNFKENGKIVGINTELLEIALQHADIQYTLIESPFKRGLHIVERTPNTMLYTVARIPQREKKFIWIGPLHKREVYLYKLRKRTDITINLLDDVKKYHTGILSGGSIEQLFISNGLNDKYYYTVNNSEQLLKMLFAGRVDLIPGDPLDLAYQLNEQGYELSNIETAFLLADEGGYYMIANKNTSKSVLMKIQKSLDEILATDVKDQIITKYVK